ncbi:MAG: bifunctional phosphopantothenoylcysteine decarboxylase/phosphopantothenate--cysteine ligase CoaBC [Acidobacteria bacterium]|nr:bifunctional phosphopantothenoylcysteine decarboxylase/phosphopantothenate--cysteine ligase CoaBC [Acidobacteriota bacterium]
MNIVLGVGGGIAAYKAAELARALMERGFAVQTVMTAAAQQFITPLTFAALTGRKVITGLFDGQTADSVLASSVEHIRAAQENQTLLVAPATADLLAKFANGIADDFLSTLYLAFTGTVILAPAMNTQMWLHPAVRANVDKLRARGNHIIDPDSGLLACGTTGPGRLPDPAYIAAETSRITAIRRDFEGETVVITAGPTQEPIDPVRYVSNRSSGKMGFAVAAAAAQRGARVILVAGPVNLATPPGVTRVDVESAVQMRDAVMAHLPEASIVIKAAAVADYTVENPPDQKIKKTMAKMSIDLSPTPDILAEVGRNKGTRILVGFAAETQNLVSEARRKMETKNCDMVAGNLVSQAGIGFGSDENEMILVPRTGEPVKLAQAPKPVIANQILDHVLKIRLAVRSGG